MAIGNSELNNFEIDRTEISGIVRDSMRNSWNTFDYASKNLKAWADETTIGTDVVNKLISLADELDRALVNTQNFLKSLDGYVQRQLEANGATAWWK